MFGFAVLLRFCLLASVGTVARTIVRTYVQPQTIKQSICALICAIFIVASSSAHGGGGQRANRKDASCARMIHLYPLSRLLVVSGIAVASLVSTHLVLLRNHYTEAELPGGDAPNSRKSASRPASKNRVPIDARLPSVPVANLGDGIGTIGPVLSCGRKKCLFPIVRVESSHENNGKVASSSEGYLLSNGDAKQYQRAYDAWRYAKFLEYHYGLRQTLLDKPVSIEITSQVAQNHLNVDFSDSGRLAYQQSTRQFEAGPAIAQPVRIVSGPWILLGCYGRHASSVTKLERFLAKMLDGVEEVNTKDKFISNFANDLNQTETILLESEVECLYHDFQLILDSRGHLIHIDLDRCLAQVRRNDGKGQITKDDQRLCMNQMHSLLEQSRLMFRRR